jgi:hypothetical protein
MIDSTIARRGETPVAAGGACVAAGAHSQKSLCRALGPQSVG